MLVSFIRVLRALYCKKFKYKCSYILLFQGPYFFTVTLIRSTDITLPTFPIWPCGLLWVQESFFFCILRYEYFSLDFFKGCLS